MPSSERQRRSRSTGDEKYGGTWRSRRREAKTKEKKTKEKPKPKKNQFQNLLLYKKMKKNWQNVTVNVFFFFITLEKSLHLTAIQG